MLYWVATNIAAGTDLVTVSFDTPLYMCQFVLSEFYNVASVDASSSNSSSSAPQVNAGLLTPSVGGDLIYNYGFDDANAGLSRRRNATGVIYCR